MANFVTQNQLGTTMERIRAWVLQQVPGISDYVELPELPAAVARQTVTSAFHQALNSARSSIANGIIRRLKEPAQTSQGIVTYPALWHNIIEVDYIDAGTRMVVNFMYGGQFYSIIEGQQQLGQMTEWTVSQV